MEGVSASGHHQATEQRGLLHRQRRQAADLRRRQARVDGQQTEAYQQFRRRSESNCVCRLCVVLVCVCVTVVFIMLSQGVSLMQKNCFVHIACVRVCVRVRACVYVCMCT